MSVVRIDYKPVSLRVRTRLPDMRCGFCGSRESDEGRVISIQHAQRAICEPCIELADEMTACARLARVPAKATPARRVRR
jgi:ribosome-binding protein aMBF1 (putative translation factor)